MILQTAKTLEHGQAWAYVFGHMPTNAWPPFLVLASDDVEL